MKERLHREYDHPRRSKIREKLYYVDGKLLFGEKMRQKNRPHASLKPKIYRICI